MNSNSRKVRKVVIPVAGMGTRFLPVTKAVPKELLPIIDKPIIQYIVEEAIAAGLESVVFITSIQKTPIENYFDSADLSSFKLKAANKEGLIDNVVSLADKIDIISIRQHSPRGLGHAILKAEPVVGGDPFAVMLGDDIMAHDTKPSIGQCLNAFEKKSEGSVIGVLDVPRTDTAMYGIVDVGGADLRVGALVQAKGFVEKPSPKQAPSTWAMPGRYVFESQIFNSLKVIPPGKGNEIQLTDAMDHLIKTRPFFAQALEGERFDTGDKLGYIKANVAFALKHEKMGAPLRAWLEELVKRS